MNMELSKKGTSSEREEVDPDPRMAWLMEVLDGLVPSGGRIGDLRNWNEISEKMKGKQFTTFGEFEEDLKGELAQRKWLDRRSSQTIMGGVEKVRGLLEAFE